MTTTPNEPHPDTTPEVVPSGEPAPNPDNPFDPAIDPEGGEPEPGGPGSGAPDRPHGDPLTEDAAPGQIGDHDTEIGA
ncbi:MAG: hypothetical protein JOZ82_02695 [Marmoricola sp.]|nr:hypothetical protein [Marmoricola sp.]